MSKAFEIAAEMNAHRFLRHFEIMSKTFEIAAELNAYRFLRL